MALSTLRLLCSDLKTDKMWRQYAGAQVHCPLPTLQECPQALLSNCASAFQILTMHRHTSCDHRTSACSDSTGSPNELAALSRRC